MTGTYECSITHKTVSFSSRNRGSVERAVGHLSERVGACRAGLGRYGIPAERHAQIIEWTWDRWVAEAQLEFDREEKAYLFEENARALLEKCLTPEQMATWRKGQYFDVMLSPGKDEDTEKKWGSGTYRIRKAHTFNVEHLESQTRFCVVAAESVPIYDQLLTQKLLLENEPAKFFAKANRSVYENSMMERYLNESQRWNTFGRALYELQNNLRNGSLREMPTEEARRLYELQRNFRGRSTSS